MAEILFQEELLWFQKLRCKWLKFRDSNSRYFHWNTIVHRQKNVVGRLLDDISEWVTDSKHLEEIVNSFYKNLFYGEGAIFNIGSFKERG